MAITNCSAHIVYQVEKEMGSPFFLVLYMAAGIFG